jgi:MtN3 and saliva related transmembrane protein
MITIVGALAAVLTTAAMFPQAIKIIRSRDVRSISLWMYVANTLGIVLWLAYGILLENFVIIFANLIGLFPAVTILSLKIKLGKES